MANITLLWDAMPVGQLWTQVRIYEGTVLVTTAAVPATSVTFSTTKATHTWTARSFDGTEESVDSNAVIWAPPIPPGHLRK